MHMTGGTFRKAIPAIVVSAIVTLAALAPGASFASSTNNCGVKGYGYHDHGKPCPNRPFPGHGKGVLRIAAQFGTVLEINSNPGNGHEKKKTETANASVTTSSDETTTSTESIGSSSKGHGHGKGHGRGHGQQTG